jgi:hypothetical protein
MAPRSNPEMPLPRSGSLFPISPLAWERNIAAFSPWGDQQLQLVVEGQASLLPADDPIRHLATLSERPALQSTHWAPEQEPLRETIAAGYVAGVCLGAAIWRDHVGLLRKQGVNVPAARVEPDTTYLVRPPLPAAKRIFRKLMIPFVDFDAMAHDYEVHTTLPAYLGKADSEDGFQDEQVWMTLLRLLNLNAAWQRNGMAIFSDPDIGQEVRDYMRLGIGDVFRLHAALNNELVDRVDNSVEYSRRRHFFPDSDGSFDLFSEDAQALWVEIEESDWRDPESLRSQLEALLQQQRHGGYDAQFFEKKWGKKFATAWNTFVPASTRITGVYHFDSGYVLSDNGEQRLRLAGDRESLHNYTLHENDTLILRDNTGRVSTLYFPFSTPSDPSKEKQTAEPVAEILGLCRLARYIPLKESAKLDVQDSEQLQMVVNQVMTMQQGQRYGRLGRVVAERAVIFRDLLPALLVPGLNTPNVVARTLGESLDWNQNQVLGVSLTTAVAIYLGMSRLVKRCLLPRLPIESDPLP